MASKDSEVWASKSADHNPRGTILKAKTDASKRRGQAVYKTKSETKPK